VSQDQSRRTGTRPSVVGRREDRLIAASDISIWLLRNTDMLEAVAGGRRGSRAAKTRTDSNIAGRARKKIQGAGRVLKRRPRPIASRWLDAVRRIAGGGKGVTPSLYALLQRLCWVLAGAIDCRGGFGG